MTAGESPVASVQQDLATVIARELSGIAAIDAAIPQASPDYVVMFHDAKMGKQANVEQMATLVRMRGGTPDERGGVRRKLTRTQASMVARASTTLISRTKLITSSITHGSLPVVGVKPSSSR